MSDETYKSYPTKCWNCSSNLPVFTFSCGICGTDNTPLDVRGSADEAARPGDAAGQPPEEESLKEIIERRKREFRKILKGD